ncbi:MAG: hypothetical protein ABIH86_01730 [Planctomycetota bacterium]
MTTGNDSNIIGYVVKVTNSSGNIQFLSSDAGSADSDENIAVCPTEAAAQELLRRCFSAGKKEILSFPCKIIGIKAVLIEKLI